MRSRLVALAMALLLALPAQVLLAGPEGKNALEYFSLNNEGRLLIRIQVWGDVALSGTHHVPDNTSLRDLLGYAGGLKGSLEDAKVTIRRDTPTQTGQTTEVFQVLGKELMGDSAKGSMLMKANDTVYVETAPTGEVTLRKLTLISTIIGIISTSLLTYYLVTKGK